MNKYLIKLISNFIPNKKCRKHFLDRRFKIIKKKECSEIVSRLFDKFSYYGKLDDRPYLRGVNAMSGVSEQTFTKLHEYLQINNSLGNKLLSVGCGMKLQLEYLKEIGFDVYGIDIDVKNDTEHLKYHNLNEYNNLPFNEGEFDFVLAQEIIEHLENPWLLIRKIKRVLKKDGILVLTTPNNSSNTSKRKFLKSSLGYTEWFNDDELWQHINPLQIFEILHILKYNNLELLEITGNEEFYYEFSGGVNSLENPTFEEKFKLSIENNSVLHFICRNLDNKIKKYNPESTYEKTKEDEITMKIS